MKIQVQICLIVEFFITIVESSLVLRQPVELLTKLFIYSGEDIMKNFPKQITYWNNELISLDESRLLIAFKEAVPDDKLVSFLKANDLVLEGDIQGKAVPGERVNNTDRRFWVKSHRPIDDALNQKIKESAEKLGLDWISPVYRISREEDRKGLLAPIPNVVVAKTSEFEGSETAIRHAIIAEMSEGPSPQLQEDVEKSKYLSGYRYFVITNPHEVNAFQIKQRLLKSKSRIADDVQFETMPFIVPTAVSPNDTFFGKQWNMIKIQAGGTGRKGWDITIGNKSVVICVLDEGCDLTHPDLKSQFSTNGINLSTMKPDGSPTGNHGTACAGIAVATYNNALGVAGVAGNCSIMPLAVQNWTETEVAAGINWATANGAGIISMSFGNDSWNHAIIDPAIQNAFNNNVVMCAATHNHNSSITYPATNQLVIAVGASDEKDNRKSPLSPDGENWGSDYGSEILSLFLACIFQLLIVKVRMVTTLQVIIIWNSVAPRRQRLMLPVWLL